MRELLILFLNSVCCTYLGEKIPRRLLSPDKWIFRERFWEKSGAIYQRVFKVKAWKTLLPELGDFVKSIFKKKHLWMTRARDTTDYLSRFIIESCKAELTHWMIIGSSFLISIWDSVYVSWNLFWLSVVLNFPYIIIQRYNRPRIAKFMIYQKTEPKY